MSGLRIASLIPSGTDLVAALGLADALVGVSHECDHPAAGGLPVLTSSVLPGPGDAPPPAEVDRLVVEAVRAGESLYRVDGELLARLAPDVVVSQDVCDVCDVCAVRAGAAGCDVPPGAELVMLSATSLAGLEEDVATLAKACGAGVEVRADAVVASVRARLADAERRVAGRPRPLVLALEWGDPPFLGGHWVPELVERAGGTHALAGPGQPSRRATWDEVAAADPDVVVFAPCGYALDAAVAEGRALVGRPEVAALRAVAEGRFWATDATRLFSRCTPDAVVAAAEALAGILHPDTTGPPGPGAAVRVVTA